MSLKERIITEARDLFAKMGYSKTKTDEIAKQIGISKRTLYENFGSKQELLDKIIDEFIENMKSTIRVVDELLKEEDLAGAINTMFKTEEYTLNIMTKEFLIDLSKIYPEKHKMLTVGIWEDFRDTFYKIFEIGKKKKYFKEHINPDILYWTIHKAQAYMQRPEVTANLPLTMVDVHRQIDEIVFAGALTELGREEYNKLQTNIKNS